MRSHLTPFLKFLIGWPLSLVALFFIGKILYEQAPSVMPNIQSIHPLLLATGIISFLVFYFLRSLIWHLIIKEYGNHILFRDSCYMWSVSELKRYIPGNIWSFLGRATLFVNRGVKKKDIGTGLIVEAQLFILGSFVVSLLSLPFLIPNYTELIGYLITGGLVLGIVLYVFNRQLTTRLKGKLQTAVHFLFPQFSPATNIRLILISSAALFFFGLGNFLTMSALFGTDLQLMWQLIGVFVLAFVAGYLSIITPAGFGVREGIVIFALSKIVPTGLAALAALFTRLILIISELLFILLSFLWHKSKSTFVVKTEKWIGSHVHETVVIVLSFIYTVYFSTVSMLRYEHYYTGRFDLGNMVQTVWNTVHGNIFMFTNPDGVEQVSRLAFHADFILILLAPLYALWQDPKMLLLIQTVVVAAGAYFVYLLSKEVLKDKNISVVLAFAYLLNPGVQRANIYDFHAVVLATTFLLATFYFLIKKKYVWFIVFAILSAICKEQIWLIIALFGFFVMILHRKWLFGAVIAAVSIGMFFFLVDYAIPNSLKGSHFAIEYFSEFGSSPLDIAKSIIFSPDKVLQTAMEEERVKFLRQILSPLGYLSLAFPFYLIFAGPDLLISLLSSNANLYQIYYQYTATMTPFIFISAVYGIWVIQKLVTKVFRSNRDSGPSKAGRQARMTFRLVVVGHLLYWSLHTVYMFGPLPGSKEPNTAMFTRPFHDKAFIDSYISQIPEDASVSASNNLGSHLSQREVIYVLPQGIDRADFVIISDKDSYEESTLETLEMNPNYRKVVHREGFVVFQRQ